MAYTIYGALVGDNKMMKEERKRGRKEENRTKECLGNDIGLNNQSESELVYIQSRTF